MPFPALTLDSVLNSAFLQPPAWLYGVDSLANELFPYDPFGQEFGSLKMTLDLLSLPDNRELFNEALHLQIDQFEDWIAGRAVKQVVRLKAENRLHYNG